ncbi:MAG: OpgC domain-containing protein [Chloroflexi bacterium]|nr:OpgC domain-containing protein [Chloroflexota bacterium]
MLNVGSANNTIALRPPLRLAWPWSYRPAKGGGRDTRLDLLRGFCLFVMAIDHIGLFGPDTWLYAVTAKGEFFISAAEGFVFISGLVMGIVYCKTIAKEGLGKSISKILQRVVKLYWLTVGLTLFFTALATYTPLKLWAERDWITIKDPVELIVGSLTLHFAYHGSSIMVMYVLFLALAPLIFYLLTQGKVRLVLAISWLVWLGNLYYPNQFSLPFQSNFPFAAWQTIFVSGLVIGYYRERLATWFKPQWRKLYFTTISITAVLLLIFFLLDKAGWAQQSFLDSLNYRSVLAEMNDKGRLPLPRILGVSLYLQAFYLLASWLWIPLRDLFGWFLVPIGEAGLYVYSMHLVLIVLIYNIPGFLELPYLLYGLAELAAISLLWVAVKTHFLFNIIPR